MFANKPFSVQTFSIQVYYVQEPVTSDRTPSIWTDPRNPPRDVQFLLSQTHVAPAEWPVGPGTAPAASSVSDIPSGNTVTQFFYQSYTSPNWPVSTAPPGKWGAEYPQPLNPPRDPKFLTSQTWSGPTYLVPFASGISGGSDSSLVRAGRPTYQFFYQSYAAPVFLTSATPLGSVTYPQPIWPVPTAQFLTSQTWSGPTFVPTGLSAWQSTFPQPVIRPRDPAFLTSQTWSGVVNPIPAIGSNATFSQPLNPPRDPVFLTSQTWSGPTFERLIMGSNVTFPQPVWTVLNAALVTSQFVAPTYVQPSVPGTLIGSGHALDIPSGNTITQFFYQSAAKPPSVPPPPPPITRTNTNAPVLSGGGSESADADSAALLAGLLGEY
jgi:hypothetical protein